MHGFGHPVPRHCRFCELNLAFGLPFDGRDSAIKGSMFVGFAERVGATEKVTRKIITDITDRAEPLVEGVEQIGWDARTTEHLKRTMNKRISELRS